MSSKFVLTLFAGAFLTMAAGFQTANAFNPQPDPPGRAISKTNTVNPATMNANSKFLPPDPCSARQPATHTVVTANRGPVTNSSVHCLNPQPLPPG